jgi:hypothetical protein
VRAYTRSESVKFPSRTTFCTWEINYFLGLYIWIANSVSPSETGVFHVVCLTALIISQTILFLMSGWLLNKDTERI